MMMYDPPSGWKYGFPRPYRPKPNETLAQTLYRDGYPFKELKSITIDDVTKHVRFWESNHDES